MGKRQNILWFSEPARLLRDGGGVGLVCHFWVYGKAASAEGDVAMTIYRGQRIGLGSSSFGLGLVHAETFGSAKESGEALGTSQEVRGSPGGEEGTSTRWIMRVLASKCNRPSITGIAVTTPTR
jgi:hypothetical protein